MRHGMILLCLLLSACAVETPEGKVCNGEIPYLGTVTGQPVTTHTGACIDDMVDEFGTAPLGESAAQSRRDADIAATHRQIKSVQP